ncbi:MAG TPA: hypothetical protein VNL74_03820 [Methylococcus sp.]|nr:hypothetical protein [Methylococcus sp.]
MYLSRQMLTPSLEFALRAALRASKFAPGELVQMRMAGAWGRRQSPEPFPLSE